MGQKHTLDGLNNLGHDELVAFILTMQGQIDTLNGNPERLIEQIRLANQWRFGCQTEKLDQIAGQMPFFNEAEADCDDTVPEAAIEETVIAVAKSPGKPKKKGQRREEERRSAWVCPHWLQSTRQTRRVRDSPSSRIERL